MLSNGYDYDDDSILGKMLGGVIEFFLCLLAIAAGAAWVIILWG